jgi:HK97 gp10 family phage protein
MSDDEKDNHPMAVFGIEDGYTKPITKISHEIGVLSRQANDVEIMSGLNELQRDLVQMTKDIDSDVEQVVKDTGFYAEGRMKKRVPVDTGKLRGSIDTTISEDGKVVTVGPNTDYDTWVELGTRKAPAQPYVRPGGKEAAQFMDRQLNKKFGDL